MAKRYSKAVHSKRRKQTSHVLKNTVILLFCAVGIWFGSSLWHAALTLQTAQPAESIAGEEFRPQVGDPPYRVVIDAGHGGADPGARGVIEEKDMTAATASELIRLLQQDSNFIPLQTRDSFDETAEWKRCPGDDDRYHEDFRGRFICRTFGLYFPGGDGYDFLYHCCLFRSSGDPEYPLRCSVWTDCRFSRDYRCGRDRLFVFCLKIFLVQKSVYEKGGCRYERRGR